MNSLTSVSVKAVTLLRQQRDCVLLLVLSVAIVGTWHSLYHFQFNCDSISYLENARYFAHTGPANYSASRPPAYPLLLVLTGVPFFDTFLGLRLMQAAQAIAIPLLVYQTLVGYGRRLALTAGLTCVAIPVTYCHSTAIMTEQYYLFLMSVFFFLASRYFAADEASQPKWLYAATFAALVMVLTRPIASVVLWSWLMLACIAAPQQIKRALMAGTAYVVVMLSWSVVDSFFLSRAARTDNIGSWNKNTFAEAYMSKWPADFAHYGTTSTVMQSEHGPATRKLRESVERFVRKYPDHWSDRLPTAWYGAYRNDPDGLLRAMFEQPNMSYCQVICAGVEMDLGHDGANRLLRDVAYEYGRRGVWRIWNDLSLGVPTRFGGQSLFWQAYMSSRYYGNYDEHQLFVAMKPENGPATRQLLEGVKAYLPTCPTEWQDLRAKFGDPVTKTNASPAQIAKGITKQASRRTWELCWAASAAVYGIEGSDVLLRDVAIETLRAYPMGMLYAWDNFATELVGPNYAVSSENKRQVMMDRTSYLNSGLETLPEHMRAEVTGSQPEWNMFDTVYFLAYLAKPVIFCLALVFVTYCWRSPSRWLVTLMLLAGVCQYASVAVFSQPTSRNHDPAYLPILLAMMCGAHYFVARGRNDAERDTPFDIVDRDASSQSSHRVPHFSLRAAKASASR